MKKLVKKYVWEVGIVFMEVVVPGVVEEWAFSFMLATADVSSITLMIGWHSSTSTSLLVSEFLVPICRIRNTLIWKST